MGSSKKGGGKYRVIDYYMSMHMAICHGPVDALIGVYVKERDAWPGTTVYDDEDDDPDHPKPGSPNETLVRIFHSIITTGSLPPSTAENPVIQEQANIFINKPELFGGDKKEGGPVGNMYWLPGSLDQVLPDILADRLARGKTGNQVPGFRGYASAFFYGGPPNGNGLDNLLGSPGGIANLFRPGNREKGFRWVQNNPYLPPTWFTVWRRPRGMSFNHTIAVGDHWPDANPAAIIYECLINTDWGMGASPAIIDVPSFEAAAATLAGEEFGLSMGWFQQATIEDFIKEVIDHIQATVFVNPRTGLITIKMIRDDYDPATLREFNPDNCKATNRQRKAWGETINEINVTWTNPANEQEETVTFQDLANISMQGATVSDTRNYYGIRRADLAAKIAARDIRSASSPLYGCDVEVDRTAWDLLPGEVCRFSWPEDGLASIVMRVGKVDYGRPGAGTIKAKLLEDIFALEQPEWIDPPRTEWTEPDQKPLPIPAGEAQVLTMPYPILSANGAAPTDDMFPRVVPGILVGGVSDDTINVDLIGPTILPNGQPGTGVIGTVNPVGNARLPGAWAQEGTTVLAANFLAATRNPELGGFGVIGTGGDEATEIVMFDSFDEATGTLTIQRGMFDTIPRAWPEFTRIWFIDNTFNAVDVGEHAAGEVVSYKLAPRTTLGRLPESMATSVAGLLSERPYLPFRPANPRVNGVAWSRITYEGTPPATLELTWANRNRLLEDTTARRWSEANVTPETGQTTKIEVWSIDGTCKGAFDELAGTSYSLDVNDLLTMLGDDNIAVLRFRAVRDGYESLQAVGHEIEFRNPGYGMAYGFYYGGV